MLLSTVPCSLGIIWHYAIAFLKFRSIGTLNNFPRKLCDQGLCQEKKNVGKKLRGALHLFPIQKKVNTVENYPFWNPLKENTNL